VTARIKRKAKGPGKGGARAGAGRKKGTPRCACGRHTLARAESLKLACRRVEQPKSKEEDWTV
jgi:hypothetical protein